MKNRIITIILTFFLGALGIHRFYLGQIGYGIIYLILSVTGISTIFALIDFIAFIVMSDRDFDCRYNGINYI